MGAHDPSTVRTAIIPLMTFHDQYIYNTISFIDNLAIGDTYLQLEI